MVNCEINNNIHYHSHIYFKIDHKHHELCYVLGKRSIKKIMPLNNMQLLTFLETNNLLFDHQYGFGKPGQLAILFLMRSMSGPLSTLEFCGESRVISLDISKAFDRVWHKGLLAKLPMFGLHQTLINWIGSFLSDRSIAVRVDGFLSNLHYINAGIPRALSSPLYSSFFL